MGLCVSHGREGVFTRELAAVFIWQRSYCQEMSESYTMCRSSRRCRLFWGLLHAQQQSVDLLRHLLQDRTTNHCNVTSVSKQQVNSQKFGEFTDRPLTTNGSMHNKHSHYAYFRAYPSASDPGTALQRNLPAFDRRVITKLPATLPRSWDERWGSAAQ